MLDEPFEWSYDGGTWRPANYRDQYLGAVTARRALELSLNAATRASPTRVGLRADPRRRRIASASRAPLPPYPSVVLGAVEVTPLEVAQAYAVIANQGLKAAVRGANKVVDRQGQIVERRPLAVERVVSPEAAYLVTHLMEGVLDRGTGRGVRDLGFTRPAAGKTGTTNDARDAWFAGFTPDLLAVVWVGFDDGAAARPHRRRGGAADLDRLHAARHRRVAADGVPAADRCCLGAHRPVHGGYRHGGAVPRPSIEAFWRGQEPTAPCPAAFAGTSDRARARMRRRSAGA